MDRYKAWASMQDGSVIATEGTIQEVANWADNLIRASEQEVTINIRRKDGEKKIA